VKITISGLKFLISTSSRSLFGFRDVTGTFMIEKHLLEYPALSFASGLVVTINF
jgi:hypothetical protein